MELVHVYQVKLGEIIFEQFDAIITACGYQARCVYTLQRLKNLPDCKLALKHNDISQFFFRDKYTSDFKNKGFHIYESSGNSVDDINKVFNVLLSSVDKNEIKLLVDYSCMKFSWYNEIVNYINTIDSKLKIEVYFLYIPALKDPELEKRKLKSVCAPGFNIKSKRQKPLALLLDVGFNSSITQKILDNIKPDVVYFFIANPALNNEHTNYIYNQHKELFERFDENNIISYPIDNINKSRQIITSTCLNTRLKYRTLLLSAGFKPFKLISSLVKLQYPDVLVGEAKIQVDRKDLGVSIDKPIIIKSVFINDEIDSDDIEEIESEYSPLKKVASFSSLNS